jgi:predicted ATPase/DNA-binding winged helix-turn-helix (wHTH) protein
VEAPTQRPSDAAVLRLGRAELDQGAHELRVDGKRAPLGPRGFGLLKFLVANRHRPVSKQELLETVWRGVIVEENNLQVQISTLRRILGPQAIATIPGRGYRFMVPILGDDASRPEALAQEGEPPARPSQGGNFPGWLPELYGREGECHAVRELVERHALVSIVGAPGIGKTRLALAAASELADAYQDGVWIVELASLNDPQLLAQTFAQALRIVLPGLREAADELAAALRDQHALIVVDNCEHLIDDTGFLISRLLHQAGRLRILVTSQEALKVTGEHLYRLAPLSVPADAQAPDAGHHGAVRLFVERVRALLPRFALSAGNAAGIVEICRRLDGLPLAIELAAARVPALGVSGVQERLGERFRVLTGGSRVAPKRHQTLRAALDWSHALLSEDERAVYRRIGVFVGSFSLESAQDLASCERIDAWAVLEHLSSLIDKSLVTAEDEARPRYRLLESTREHALEQLASAGETDAWIARHAGVTRRALERAIRDRRTDLVLAEMGNVRSAYAWARDPPGDAMSAVALATLPSMVIAVEGAVQEARQRLLEVEPLLGDGVPRTLLAQYWQWYGRIGLGGRLPAVRCVEALQRAEHLFIELGNLRHVHACRRHLAEAMLDAGDLDGAASALQSAREMEEGVAWPLADRTRRLRVEGLWLAKAGRFAEALRTSSLALELARQARIDRYELVLLDDIARMHLEAGNAHEAAERYRALAEQARHTPNAGLTLSNALAGLVAALTGDDDLDGADSMVEGSLPVLRRSAILIARADIFACLMARRGRFQLAARLIGASDRFRQSCGTARDPVDRRSHEEAMALLCESVDEVTRTAWIEAGTNDSEDELAAALARGLDRST